MKKLTQVKVIGFILFMVGSVIIQQFIDPLLFIGIAILYFAMQIIDSIIELETAERRAQELQDLIDILDKFPKEIKDEKQPIQPID